jgi:hypothetical protein
MVGERRGVDLCFLLRTKEEDKKREGPWLAKL